MSDSAEDALRELTEFPRVFGNYLLLQSLARGGMGEVFLAKSGGIAGIEKHCVVKTLRGHYTMDREYVTRFIDEARVVVQLHHRNICQIYDVGRVAKQYYLAMEYVVGRDLRTIQQRAKTMGLRFERPMVLHIVSEVLEALDYAHRLVDPISGEPIKLVHRDVSPQNIMVSFEGEVKLIDFGLAQSTKKVEKTQPHVVMGKMAYMAPEQARGDAVDGRADLFAVAVLLYELLADERFYEGMGFDQIWGVAGRGGHVPRQFHTIDAPLREILSRALEPDLEKRYATCADFKDDLIRYQVQSGKLALSRDIRGLMTELFATESQAHREVLARFQNVRMIQPRDVEESQSFARLPGTQESIAQAPAVSDGPPTQQSVPLTESAEAVGDPLVPLRNDEKTVTAFFPTGNTTDETRDGPVVEDRTIAERSPIPELSTQLVTRVADKREAERDTVVVATPDAAASAPRGAGPSVRATSDHTEIVRTPLGRREPEVAVVRPDAAAPRRSLVPLLAGAALALAATVGALVLLVPAGDATTGDPSPGETATAPVDVKPVPRDPVVREDPPPPVPVDARPADPPPRDPVASPAATPQEDPGAKEPEDAVADDEPERGAARGDRGDRGRKKPKRPTTSTPTPAATPTPPPPAPPKPALPPPPPDTATAMSKLMWLKGNCGAHRCTKDLQRDLRTAPPDALATRATDCVKFCVRQANR